MCPPGRKVVPSNTEGRFRLDKPASATVRCPQSWGGGRQERRGLQVSQELPGRGPGVPQARPVGAVVGWGRWGRCAPASPGTAAWTQTACRWCVLVSILCPPVHDMLKCPPIRIPGTPRLPADCVLVLGNGLSCVLRHGAGKNFPCFAHSGGTCARALCSGQREKCGGEGGGTSRGVCWAAGAGERGPPLAGLHNLFSVCLSLFFPFALSVSSLLIRSPNPPAFTVEKPDTQVSGASGLHTCVQYSAHTQLTWWGDGGRRGEKNPLNLLRAGLDPNLHGAGSKRVGVAVFKKI